MTDRSPAAPTAVRLTAPAAPTAVLLTAPAAPVAAGAPGAPTAVLGAAPRPGPAHLDPRSLATPMRAVLSMFARDFRVLRRDLVNFILRTLVQPALFTFVFAYVMPRISGRGAAMSFGVDGTSFATVLLTGLVASTTVISGMSTVTTALMAELSYTKELEDRLLTPAPVWLLGLQKIGWGAAHGLISGLIVLPVVWLIHSPGQGPRVHVTSYFVLAVVTVFVPLQAGSVGLLLGSVLDSHKFNALITYILVPATMLGCVYYPWSALGAIRWLQIVVLLNPIVYAGEGLRAALVPGMPHMPAVAFVPVLVLGTLGLAWWAVRAFSRRVVN